MKEGLPKAAPCGMDVVREKKREQRKGGGHLVERDEEARLSCLVSLCVLGVHALSSDKAKGSGMPWCIVCRHC